MHRLSVCGERMKNNFSSLHNEIVSYVCSLTNDCLAPRVQIIFYKKICTSKVVACTQASLKQIGFRKKKHFAWHKLNAIQVTVQIEMF